MDWSGNIESTSIQSVMPSNSIKLSNGGYAAIVEKLILYAPPDNSLPVYVVPFLLGNNADVHRIIGVSGDNIYYLTKYYDAEDDPSHLRFVMTNIRKGLNRPIPLKNDRICGMHEIHGKTYIAFVVDGAPAMISTDDIEKSRFFDISQYVLVPKHIELNKILR